MAFTVDDNERMVRAMNQHYEPARTAAVQGQIEPALEATKQAVYHTLRATPSITEDIVGYVEAMLKKAGVYGEVQRALTLGRNAPTLNTRNKLFADAFATVEEIVLNTVTERTPVDGEDNLPDDESRVGYRRRRIAETLSQRIFQQAPPQPANP